MLPSKCHLPLVLSLAQVTFIFSLFTLSGTVAEESIKSQANAAISAEQRQRNMLETSVKPFFDINNAFLDIVQQNSINGRLFIDFVGNITNGKQESVTDYFNMVKPIIVTYPGYVALILFGILLFILIPIIGIFWCTCRCCCHKCGARAKPMDGKYARCRRGTFAVILGILCTLVLAGSVLAFISNDLLHRPFKKGSRDNPVTVINSSIIGITDNMENILKTFNNETLALLAKKVPEVKNAIRNASSKAQEEVIKLTKLYETLSRWTSLSQSITKYLATIDDLSSNGTEFVAAMDNLTSNLPNLTRPLIEKFNACNATACKNATEELMGFTVTLDVSGVNLKLVSTTKDALKSVNVTEISTYFDFVNETLHNISVKITDTGATQIKNLMAKLNDSQKIEEYFMKSERYILDVTSVLRRVTGMLNNQTFMGQKISPFLEQMDQYRMYGYIGVGSTVLLIIFFYYLGLCFGACGEPPYEDARLCNRGVGATLMSCGVGFTFLFFPIVILVVMVTFMVGGPTRTEFCRYLLNEKPSGYGVLDSEISQLLKQLNISIAPGYSYPPNLTYHIMGDCRSNTSLITAFGLEDLVNGSLIYESEVRPSLRQLQKKIEEIDLKVDVSTITKQAVAFVDNFEKGGIEVSAFTSTIAELEKGVTKNFTKLVLLLRDGDAAANGTIGVNSTIERLTALIDAVNSSKTSLLSNFESLKSVSNIKQDMNTFRGLSEDLNKNLKPKGPSLKRIIDTAFNDLDATLKKILINAVENVLNQYASCRLLHEKVKGIADIFCRNILNPFNGFWLGIGWCLLILIPSMIFACKLNYLYRKTEYYVKDYEEPDYMSYQGFYPSDSIPLERKSRGKNKQAKGRSRNGPKSRAGTSGGILRHTGPPDPLPSGVACGPGAAGVGGLNRRGWQHPYTKLPVYPRDAYD